MEDLRKVLDYMNEIPGSFTETHGRKLYEYALQCSGVIVEVGCDQCRSGSIILHAARKTGSHVFFVDNWRSVLAGNYDKVKERIARDFPDVKAEILFMDSVDAAPIIIDRVKQFQMIHIDADHFKPAVLMDCLMWLPALESGGMALFHDYDAKEFDVKECVDIHCADWENLGEWEGYAIRRKP